MQWNYTKLQRRNIIGVKGPFPTWATCLETNSDWRDAQNSDNNNLSFIEIKENLDYNMIALYSLQHIWLHNNNSEIVIFYVMKNALYMMYTSIFYSIIK